MQATSPPRRHERDLAPRHGASPTESAAAKSDAAPVFLAAPHRQNRRARKITGVGLASVSVAGLIIGGAMSSAAADNQATRLAVSSAVVRDADTTTSGRDDTSQGSDAIPTPSIASTSTSEWSAMFGGDSLLTQPRGGSNPFDRQDPLMRSADLALINVETAISDSTLREPKQYNFRSPVRFAEMMAEAGIDVGSLANNHSLDFGDQGMIDTVDALQDAGVAAVGAGVNLAAALKPSFHSIKGVRVAVIGASQVIPDPAWIATANSIGIAAAGKRMDDQITASLVNAIREARSQADVVIVFMHWGGEKQVCPSELQQQTAEVLHQAGAAVVVGAHPHVLQPLVRQPGQVTAYSLGNFIWDPRSGITADTGILEVRFRGPAIDKVLFHPHRLDGNGWAAPTKDPQSVDRILGQIERNCAGADGTGSLDR